MREDELIRFVDTVAAAAIAAKTAAILTAAGLAITRENAAQLYGRTINPASPHFERLVRAVDAEIADMMNTLSELREPPKGSA